MAQDRNLPEGTDKIVSGAGNSGGAGGTPGAGGTGGARGGGGREDVIVTETTIVAEVAVPAPEGPDVERSREGSGSPSGGMAQGSGQGGQGGTSSQGGGSSGQGGIKDKVREGSQKLTGQAADKGRDFVSQGLERSSDALSNVSRLVGETASGLDERLGSEYGDYARRAAEAIDSTAQRLRSKDPDELIDDTRDFVRKSPGVALAGAAIVGFALARLVKTGLQTGGGQQSGGQQLGGQQSGGVQPGREPGGAQPTGAQPTGGQPRGGQPTGGQPTGGQPTGGQTGGFGQQGPRGGAS